MPRYSLRFQLSQPTLWAHVHTQVALFSLLRPIDVFRVAASWTGIDELAEPLAEKKKTRPIPLLSTLCPVFSFLSFYFFLFILEQSFVLPLLENDDRDLYAYGFYAADRAFTAPSGSPPSRRSRGKCAPIALRENRVNVYTRKLRF